MVVDLTLIAMGPMLVLLIGVDRLALVKLGARYNSVETHNRAILKLLLCWSGAFLFYCPPIVVWDLARGYSIVEEGKCFPEYKDNLTFMVTSEVLSTFVPFTALSVINCMLCRAIRKRFEKMAHMFTSSPPPGATPAILLQHQKTVMNHYNFTIFDDSVSSTSVKDGGGCLWCQGKPKDIELPSDVYQNNTSLRPAEKTSPGGSVLRPSSKTAETVDVSSSSSTQSRSGSVNMTADSPASPLPYSETPWKQAGDPPDPPRRNVDSSMTFCSWMCCWKRNAVHVSAVNLPATAGASILRPTSPILRIGDEDRAQRDFRCVESGSGPESASESQHQSGSESDARRRLADSVSVQDTTPTASSPDTTDSPSQMLQGSTEGHQIDETASSCTKNKKRQRKVTFSTPVSELELLKDLEIARHMRLEEQGARGDVNVGLDAETRHNHLLWERETSDELEWDKDEIKKARHRFRFIDTKRPNLDAYHYYRRMRVQELRRQRQLQRLYKRQSRVERLLVVLVLALLVTWFPYSVTRIVEAVSKTPVNKPIGHIVLFLLWFKSCLNPFLYAYNSPRFQKNFAQLTAPLVRLCPCTSRLCPSNADTHYGKRFQVRSNTAPSVPTVKIS
nr:hypothetical protein BaRGS_017230 [Batillaria attramentaria]